MSDPLDESAPADVLSSHDGEDFRAFGVPRWPGFLRQVIRRGKSVRLRRVGGAACVLGLAGIGAAIVATMAPTPRSAPEQAFPVTVQTTSPAPSGGVFASGTADGHAWRLAVQDIADPGYRCLPAITLNGTDADPVSPDPGSGADVVLGPAVPGVGFAFVQLPADIRRLAIDDRELLPAVTVTACGERYRLVGFAFPLTQELGITVADARPSWPKLRINAVGALPGWPARYYLPPVGTWPPATATTSQTEGLWNTVNSTRSEAASATIATGQARGQDWSIRLMFGTRGDCYEFSGSGSLGRTQLGACGPVGTPDGAETIMALPLGFPNPGTGATGYAVQVSPGTVRLRATLSDGSSVLVAPRLVDGRKYAAFIVGTSLRLERLTWLNAAGKVLASTIELPRYGYVQFRP
jgi:hypothetical protein